MRVSSVLAERLPIIETGNKLSNIMSDKIEQVDELAANNFGIRSALESASKGCTAHVARAKATEGARPTLDDYMAESNQLVAVLKNLISAGGDSGRLEAENKRLTSENEKLSAQLASFDERVARETAMQVASLGFSDKPANFMSGASSKTKPADPAALTATQKVLKAKGLPLDTKIQTKTVEQSETED